MNLKITLFVLIALYVNNVICEIDNCNFRTCGECIGSYHDRCVWCAKEDFNQRRCVPYETLKENASWCDPKFLQNPKPKFEIKKDKKFNELDEGKQVQFRPQLIHVKTRPGLVIPFEMSYKPAQDFPLDVYYLMDVSFTMRKKFEDLKNQAVNIYKELSAYTNNVRLGAGSFVEKPGFPFVDTAKQPPHESHTFRNLISLTNDTNKFLASISEDVKLGSNYDDPEAGLDALMQAMVCEKELGWRKDARRIIVLCTDSTYHSAGDGKIVGAIKPHDMKCHLKNNEYTMALKLDYPSVSQINKVATDGRFKIIFAIAKNDDNGYTPDKEYELLAQHITGAKQVKLEGGNSVIKIIKEAYNEATRTVEVNYVLPPYVELAVDQNCKTKPTRNCETTHTEPIVTIKGNITVKHCPRDRKYAQKFDINPVGINDKLTIELNVDCECDCEKNFDPTKTSPKCNNAGGLQCGICKCLDGIYGVDCRCNGTYMDQQDLLKSCQLDDKVCSGRGNCSCGICECGENYSGQFCEFNDKSCPMPNGRLCFGKGVCTLGRCQCDAGWTQDDCSCPLSKDTCIAPYSKEECSGNGKCKCGVCICNKQDDKNETYTGAFCDSCEKCAEKRCKELEDYAYCNFEHPDNKTYCDELNNGTTTDIAVSIVNKNEINSPAWFTATWCRKETENGSFVLFKYQYEEPEHKLHLAIRKELELPPVANLWIAAGSALGLVLLIGILTVVIWKILVDLHDKREYEKFASEARAAGYDVSTNPLYEAPANTIVNPTFSCN